MNWRGNHALLVAIAGLGLALAYLGLGAQLDVGKFAAPGAGLYPRVLGIVLLVIAVRGVWTTARAAQPERFTIERVEALRVFGAIIVMLAYGAMLDTLGSIVVTFLLSLVSLLVMGWRGWFKVVASAGIVAVGVHLLFVKLLGVQMPLGLLAW